MNDDSDDTTDPPWTCHRCYAPCAHHKLQKCPKPTCAAKRLQAEKPPADPKALIGKDALKIIDSAEKAAEDAPDDAKKRAGIKDLRKTIDQAKKYGWSLVLDNAEKSSRH